MIKAFIFDIGGVLFLAKPNRKEKNILSSFSETLLLLNDFGIDTSAKKELLLEIYLQSSKGTITKEETLRQMSEQLGVEPRELEELFRKVYAGNTIENKVLYQKILELKKRGYKLGILSTQFHLSKEVLIPKKFYEDFDVVVSSCDDKLKKPDEEAYNSVLKQLGVEPGESVFVDDQQKNIDAAEKLGMKAVLFRDNDQFLQVVGPLIDSS